MIRTTLRLLGCLVALSTGAAYAESEGEELVENVAVRNRLFSVKNRFELGAHFGLSILSQLTEHYNLNLTVAYNLADWMALELRGGYAISRHASVADEIQSYYRDRASRDGQGAPDLWELTGHGVFGLRFQPVYGKINLVSDLPIHFQMYIWAGGGAGYLKKEEIDICAQPKTGGSVECPDFQKSNKISPLVSLALGFRFFLPFEHHSLKLEIRDWSFLDSYESNVRRDTNVGTPSPNAGITNIVQLDVGYAFIF